MFKEIPPVEYSDQNHVEPFDRPAFAEEFAQQNLFHQPTESLTRLGIQEIPPGQKILDIGSGTNELVEELRKRGANAVGIDFAEPGQKQNPDILAEAHNLPFPDGNFDTIINHYGGLTYPLHMGFETNFSPEQEHRLVTRFLEQLQESLRVTREGGQIHIYPWSAYPFYELTGTLNVDNPDLMARGINFLRIDFKKLFHSAGLSTELGQPVRRSTAYAPRNTAIAIRKTADYDSSVIQAKAAKIASAGSPLFLHAHELQNSYPLLHALTKEICDQQGLLNEYRDQTELAQEVLAGEPGFGLLDITGSLRDAAALGITLNGPDRETNILNYQHYLDLKTKRPQRKLDSLRERYLDEFNQKIELL